MSRNGTCVQMLLEQVINSASWKRLLSCRHSIGWLAGVAAHYQCHTALPEDISLESKIKMHFTSAPSLSLHVASGSILSRKPSVRALLHTRKPGESMTHWVTNGTKCFSLESPFVLPRATGKPATDQGYLQTFLWEWVSHVRGKQLIVFVANEKKFALLRK